MLKGEFIYPKILVESIDDPLDSTSFNLNLNRIQEKQF